VSSDPGAFREGHLPIRGYEFFWKSFGDDGSKGTVVMLHGGPGGSHDYLLSFADLARQGYRVVLYDQLGCGATARAKEDQEYSVERDVADLDALRTGLELGRVHVIGSSYGGMLALAYALAHPEGVRSLVIASGLASVPLARSEMERLCRELPPPFPALLEKHAARGEFDHPEYQAATELFYRRHVCRLDPWPAELLRTFQLMDGSAKYRYMNGPNEFTITGTTRDFDLTPRLGEIRAPTLVTVGRYDEVTPTVARAIRDGIPGAELTEFSQSSHSAFWEERERYMERVGGFLSALPGG
jgi:proline iminopeptidase